MWNHTQNCYKFEFLLIISSQLIAENLHFYRVYKVFEWIASKNGNLGFDKLPKMYANFPP